MLSKLRVLASVENDRSDAYVPRVAKQRQRFTPWLKNQIVSGDIDGLEWIDVDKGVFKVPWMRVDKPEFELETHAELFRRWAQHTGKYRPGDQPDPSTWKTRFRCALRKMQEIVEIEELGNLEGSNPYRAFKFEPPKLKENARRTTALGKANNFRAAENARRTTAWDKANNFRAAENARRTVVASNKANKWSANLKGNVLRQDRRKGRPFGLCGQRNSLGKRGA